MQKFLIGLTLLTIIAVPLVALAADAPQECCRIKRAVQIEEGGTTGVTTYAKGDVVGPTAGSGYCFIGGVDTNVTKPTASWGLVCILNTLNSIIDWIFTALVILVVFFTILGAWTIVTAGGKAENVNTGKNFILYAAIGLAVAFLARALPGIVKAIAGF